jgi:hypothetical protein
MMAKPFQTLREKMSPAAQQRVAEKAEAIIRDMPLDELRAARHLTQEQLGKGDDDNLETALIEYEEGGEA